VQSLTQYYIFLRTDISRISCSSSYAQQLVACLLQDVETRHHIYINISIALASGAVASSLIDHEWQFVILYSDHDSQD
jgi:hypothetical protein